MAEQGLQLFGGDWTERKLDAVGRYLKAYTTVLSGTAFARVYIDAFAGTGYRERRIEAPDAQASIFADALDELSEPEPQRFLDGSAKIALRVEPPFHRFVLVECVQSKVAELEKLKKEFPPRAAGIDIRTGDANETIRELCRTWDRRNMRGVLFLDPFGMQVEWSTLEAVAATECIDTWILFPFAANRLMTKSPKDIPTAWRRRLDALFGTDEWERRFYTEHTVHDIFGADLTITEKRLTLKGLGAFYGERLRAVFKRVAPNPRVLRSDRNRPLFQFFFAAGNPGKGGEIALRIAKHILDKI